jgi:hypothetical protein
MEEREITEIHNIVRQIVSGGKAETGGTLGNPDSTAAVTLVVNHLTGEEVKIEGDFLDLVDKLTEFENSR